VTHDQMEAMSMGDRIAVMNLGELQQIGDPHEVYANPKNLFVAQFIGSPGMNFLRCTVQNGDGELSLRMQAGGHAFSISNELRKMIQEQRKTDKQLILGVRPEDVMLSMKQEDNYLPGEVYIEEKMGSYNIVDVKYGEEVVKVRTLPSTKVEVGQNVYISFDLERLRLFDSETEQSITGESNTGENGNG